MLAEILPIFKSLETLNLEENAINDVKFECIIPAIVSLNNLKSLNLAKNALSSISMANFIDELKEKNKISNL